MHCTLVGLLATHFSDVKFIQLYFKGIYDLNFSHEFTLWCKHILLPGYKFDDGVQCQLVDCYGKIRVLNTTFQNLFGLMVLW